MEEKHNIKNSEACEESANTQTEAGQFDNQGQVYYAEVEHISLVNNEAPFPTQSNQTNYNQEYPTKQYQPEPPILEYPYGQPPYQQNQLPPPGGQPPYSNGWQSYPATQPNYTPNQNGARTVVVIKQAPAAYQQPIYVQSFGGQIALACCVFWCFGFLFGLIAFILAMVASSSATEGKVHEAASLGRASYGVSIAGIVVGCIAAAIIIGITVSQANSSSSGCTYYNGRCY